MSISDEVSSCWSPLRALLPLYTSSRGSVQPATRSTLSNLDLILRHTRGETCHTSRGAQHTRNSVISRAGNTRTAGGCHRHTGRGADALATWPGAGITGPSVAYFSFQLTDASLESIILALHIVKLLPIKGRLLVSGRCWHHRRRHYVAGAMGRCRRWV